MGEKKSTKKFKATKLKAEIARRKKHQKIAQAKKAKEQKHKKLQEESTDNGAIEQASEAPKAIEDMVKMQMLYEPLIK
jgi:hypothetical protein